MHYIIMVLFCFSGSPGWLVAAVTLGLLLCIVIIWSTKDTIDKIKSMNVYGSKVCVNTYPSIY